MRNARACLGLVVTLATASGCLPPLKETGTNPDAGDAGPPRPEFGVVTAVLSQAAATGPVRAEVGAALFLSPEICPNRCAEAMARSGDCCLLPPTAPLPTDVCASGSALNAGPLTFSDDTSGMSLGTINFTSAAPGYTPLVTAPWVSGDQLTFFAAGGPDLAMFGGVLAAVGLPSIGLSSTVVGQSLAIAWASDPNADLLRLQIDLVTSAPARKPLGTILCQAADQLGTLSVDSALLKGVHATDLALATASRQRSIVVRIKSDQIRFLSRAIAPTLSAAFQ